MIVDDIGALAKLVKAMIPKIVGSEEGSRRESSLSRLDLSLLNT